ncbi:MAG: hypothetical protein JRH15_08355, partial [Deltaproteobacteria bacterium]|nr:hypothetical protein [Deltaproteobacteria bacterium]
EPVHQRLDTVVAFSNERIENRISAHMTFMENRFKEKGTFRYQNRYYRFPVVTNQETQLLINSLRSIRKVSNTHFEVDYETNPQKAYCGGWEGYFDESSKPAKRQGRPPKTKESKKPIQLEF